MSFKPAHKDIDTPPGQIVNSVSVPETHRSKTIGGIVDRVMRSEAQPIKQKLTFDEWYHQHWKECKSGTFDLHTTYALIWKAAQENT